MLVNTHMLFQLLVRLFQPRLVCDVGSLDGFHSRRFRLLAPDARVVAFEANPNHVGPLESALAGTGIEVEHRAVTDRDGQLTFHVESGPADGSEPGHHGISSTRRRTSGSHGVTEVEVDAVRLDTFLAEADPTRCATFLWIDVEGAGYEVLDGIRRLRERVGVVHVEVETEEVWRDQKLAPAVRALMEELGFVELASGRAQSPRQHDVVFLSRALLARAPLRCRAALWAARLLTLAQRAGGRAFFRMVTTVLRWKGGSGAVAGRERLGQERKAMTMRARVRALLNRALRRYGYELVASPLVYDWQRHPELQRGSCEPALPEEADRYLTPDNPRLVELQERYRAFDRAVTDPLVWTEGHVGADDLRWFRGDNAYVWQLRGPAMNVVAYALATYYVKAVDRLGLLQRLQEDGCFGNVTFDIDGTLVSRDLLDSILQIDFLDRHLHIASRPGLTFLDIGAGYGRLAHRLVTALPDVARYDCTDGYAASTFLSEYYLRFRGLSDRTRVVALDEIEGVLADSKIDIAVNIHSFSECTVPAIRWWLRLLRTHRVGHLMIVPNPVDHAGEHLHTNDGHDIAALVTEFGYRRIAKDPKYRDPIVQKYAMGPTCYYLFERASSA